MMTATAITERLNERIKTICEPVSDIYRLNVQINNACFRCTTEPTNGASEI